MQQKQEGSQRQLHEQIVILQKQQETILQQMADHNQTRGIAHAERQEAKSDGHGQFSWTDVVKKRRVRGESSTAKGKAKDKAPIGRKLPPAIIVRRGEDSFPDLLKTINSNVCPEVTGANISKIRETRNGSLLIEVDGGPDDILRISGEIARVMSPDASIRSPEKRALVEIRDLDATTTREEVSHAVIRDCAISAEKVRILSTRRIYGGGQAAVVLVPNEAARKLRSIGRIRIGLVYCKIEEGEFIKRYYDASALATRRVVAQDLIGRRIADDAARKVIMSVNAQRVGRR